VLRPNLRQFLTTLAIVSHVLFDVGSYIGSPQAWPPRRSHTLLLRHRHQILLCRMTCVTTLFGTVPISAKPLVVAGGLPNHRSLTT